MSYLHFEDPKKRSILLAGSLALVTLAMVGCSTGNTGNNSDGSPDTNTTADGSTTDVRANSDVTPGQDVTPGRDVVPGQDVTPGMDVTPGQDVTTVPDVQPGQDVTPPSDVTVTPGHVAVTQFGFDLQRTAANRNETALTVASVMGGHFARDTAFTPPTFDGAIYAQPLYVPQLTINGGTHDVLYVATQHNTVYALDAASGAMLWNTTVAPSVHSNGNPHHDCGNLNENGILGTPVIDVAGNTIYAVADTIANNAIVFTINALDLVTGTQHAGYPQAINPPTSNGATFTPGPTGERAAITFINGKVYVPFGGRYGDCGNYHGWVVGIDTANPSTSTSWATAAPGHGSGIWGVGGPSSDGAGNLFAATGNGYDNGSGAAMGEEVVRLSVGATGPTLATGNANFFAPSNRSTLDNGDTDISSNQPIVLPDAPGSNTPHLVYQAGKAGVGYLVNRDNLGGISAGNGVDNEAVYSRRVYPGGVYGAGAAWSDGSQVYVFSPGNGTRGAPCTGSDGVTALRLGVAASGSSTMAPAWCTSSLSNAIPAVSSNGNSNPILWVVGVGNNNRYTLSAFDITNGTQIFTANDATGGAQHWLPPIIADGRVFVAGSTSVSMYRVTN